MKKTLNDKVLSSLELIELRGGAGGCYVCSCTNHPGTWYGRYGSLNEANQSTTAYCGGHGGNCQSSSSSLCPPAQPEP